MAQGWQEKKEDAFFFTGKISLTIPWTNPYSEPYEITVRDVYLIAGPIRGKL